ncbi:MAG: cardiolipin synthase [Noviherbaspirillum sp.]|jgi:cardiolipin synthase|nr:cardiolipin synthase [Noviherbaspirillum sp.]
MRSVKFSAHNQVTLLHNGAEYFPALIAALDAAKFEVYLETYIFAADQTADQVKAALIRAAGRGVKVNVVTDWLGTGHRQSAILSRDFRQARVNHRIFNAWFRRGVVRMHRKICVVDRQVAFLGGLNINCDMISDDGFNDPLPAPRWDFAVRVRGPLVATIHEAVLAQWLYLSGLHLRYRLERFLERRADKVSAEGSPALAGLVLRDNLHNRRTIQRAYLKALGSARKSALLANPYFAPNRKLRDGLAAAARRGVDVTLLIGVGQFRLQDAVAHSFYPKLLKAGVKIYEYRKTQLHAKVAVVDDDWTTVGSSNWDGISLLINQEANIVVRGPEAAGTLRMHIENALVDAVRIQLQDYVNIPWYKRASHAIAHVFYKSALWLVTLGRPAD